MKQGTLVNRIVMLLFLAAILLYFGGAAWRSFRDPYPTVLAYAYSVDDTVETTGYLARRETVLTGSGGIVRLIPAEGEKVSAGATVAVLYADQASVERSDRLEALEQEAAQMAQAIADAGSPARTDQTGSEVIDAMVELRSAVEAGDFTRLETQTLAFKSAVYQQAQRYGNAGDLSAALSIAQAEIAALKAQSAQDTGRIATGRSGIFSGQVDGYESVLTPELLPTLTPSAIDALEGQALPVDATALCKLIGDTKWYFICPLAEADAARLVEGDGVTARFSRDWSGEVGMTVERIGAPENGRVAVTLSSTRFLSNTTLLRRQTVDLLFATRTGIRVPTAAVRLEGEVTGVYVQVGAFAEFKPVTVLAQGEDYYLVEPLLPEDAAEEAVKKALRPGDLVIVASQEIWDGKVVD